MTTDLPPAIAADALVSDEEHQCRGAAIKTWIDGAIAEYQPHAAITDLTQSGDQTIATAQVSGTFPGRPIQLRYPFHSPARPDCHPDHRHLTLTPATPGPSLPRRALYDGHSAGMLGPDGNRLH